MSPWIIWLCCLSAVTLATAFWEYSSLRTLGSCYPGCWLKKDRRTDYNTEVDFKIRMVGNLCPLRILSSFECVFFWMVLDPSLYCLMYRNINYNLELSVLERQSCRKELWSFQYDLYRDHRLNTCHLGSKSKGERSRNNKQIPTVVEGLLDIGKEGE